MGLILTLHVQFSQLVLCSGDKAASAAEKEGTKRWRAALVAARPEVPVATTARARHRKEVVAEYEGVDMEEVEDLEDPVMAEEPQVPDGSDDDKFDDAGVYATQSQVHKHIRIHVHVREL